MILFGLVLVGSNAYMLAGEAAAKSAIVASIEKLAIQVPAGIIAVLIAARLIDFDFGTLGTVALKIAGITILAEGVGVWAYYVFPFFYFHVIAELTVMLIGFFWLFELSKWETYLIVLLNFAVLFGAYYVLGKYTEGSRSPMNRPRAHARR
jgi:hypothetical protein